MDKKVWIIAAVIVIIAIAAAYFVFVKGDDGTITIGYQPSDHDAALFVAEAQEQYKNQGLNVKTVQFKNGGDMLTAMASGDVDIGYIGLTPALSGIQNGVPIKVISGAQLEGSAILVSDNSTINSVADLKGKTVATLGEASIQHFLLSYALNASGLSISDVEESGMKSADMVTALRDNKVDAIFVPEPFATTVVENGYGRILEDSGDIISEHPCCVIVASDDFIKNHPNETKKIVEINTNATEFIQNNATGAAALLPDDIVSNLSIEEISLEGLNFVSGLSDAYKQNVMDFMQKEVDLGVLNQKLTESQIFYDTGAPSI